MLAFTPSRGTLINFRQATADGRLLIRLASNFNLAPSTSPIMIIEAAERGLDAIARGISQFVSSCTRKIR